MSKPKKRLEPAPLARLRSLAQGDCTTARKQQRREDLRWLLAEYDRQQALI